MEFGFENRLDPKWDYLEERYRKLMQIALDYLQIKRNLEVDLSLVDDETIHAINRDYRSIDRVTDVISFAFDDDKDNPIQDDEIPHLLGEIFLDVPQALRQAKEYGNSEERELSFLFVHGLLHLLGYDHMKKEDEEIMFPLQERILALAKESEEK